MSVNSLIVTVDMIINCQSHWQPYSCTGWLPGGVLFY